MSDDLVPVEAWSLVPLRGVVAEMRALGVVRYKTDHLELELGPVPPPAPDPNAKPEPEEPPEVCPCGHLKEEEHNGAGCLLGCSHELCVGSGQRPQPEEDKP